MAAAGEDDPSPPGRRLRRRRGRHALERHPGHRAQPDRGRHRPGHPERVAPRGTSSSTPWPSWCWARSRPPARASGATWPSRSPTRSRPTSARRCSAGSKQLDFQYHDDAQTGQLMARSATDLQQINAFATMIPITIANFLTVALVSVVLLVIDWQLALAGAVLPAVRQHRGQAVLRRSCTPWPCPCNRSSPRCRPSSKRR